jgi:hypothetical protein
MKQVILSFEVSDDTSDNDLLLAVRELVKDGMSPRFVKSYETALNAVSLVRFAAHPEQFSDSDAKVTTPPGERPPMYSLRPYQQEAVDAGLRAALDEARACFPPDVNLDAIAPQVLKRIEDYYMEVDRSLKNSTAARERLRTLTFEELFRAYCAWSGYAVNYDSLAFAALCIHAACQGNSNPQ